jgi:dipeptidyl-peptidase-4
MFAKFSPDSSQVAYVRANDIYVEPVGGGKVTQLTLDGSATTINGTSDWVYEEELGVRDCFEWSPDSARIAYWQFDTTGVGVFSLINNTDTLYPVITRIPYPKVGTTNSAVRIGVLDLKSHRTRWMNTPGDPRDDYLARMQWADETTVAIQQLNRLQNRHDVLLADVRTGETRRFFRDESKTWIDPPETIRWIDQGSAFLVLSERDGWRHAYRVAREGGDLTLLTRFDADLTNVVGVDDSRGWLYFLASPDDATARYLYRSKLDGSAHPERVTPKEQPGTHTYVAAPNATLAFHTYSRIDQPPAMDVVEAA